MKREGGREERREGEDTRKKVHSSTHTRTYTCTHSQTHAAPLWVDSMKHLCGLLSLLSLSLLFRSYPGSALSCCCLLPSLPALRFVRAPFSFIARLLKGIVAAAIAVATATAAATAATAATAADDI